MTLDDRYQDRQVLADKIGKSVSWVHNVMKLLELHPTVQKVLAAGVITEWHAIAIARLQPDDQLRALKACQLRDVPIHGVPGGSTMSVRALKEWIAQNIHMDLGKAPFPTEDVTLVPAAGACGACPKRAGANAALLEAKTANTCTDRSCYEAKTRAHTEKRVEALSAADAPAVRLVRAFYLPADEKKWLGNPLTGDQYRAAGKQVCAHTRAAVLLDAESGAVVEETTVCVEPGKCSVHSDRHERASGVRREPSAAEKAEATRRKKQERQRQVEGEVRRRILFAVRDKVDGALGVEDLRLIARRFLHEMHADRQKQVYGWMGWEKPAPSKRSYGGPYVDFRKAAVQEIDKADIAVLSRFLVVAALSQDADVSLNLYYTPDKVSLLYDTAKRWKVDAARLERDVRAGAAAVDKARAAKSAAKKKPVETSPRAKAKAKKKR
jgi:hypothetical protein